MAAYAAVVSLMNTIEQMMSHPRLSTSFHNDQIQSLQKKAASLLDFIEGGYDNYAGGSQDLETLIASAAHTAEDMIESHIVNQILALSADEDMKKVLSFSLYLQKKMAIEEKNTTAAHVDQIGGGSNQASLSSSHYLQHIIEDMDAIIEKVNKIKEKEMSREEQPSLHSTPLTKNVFGEETAMVGFDDELLQLLDELTSQRSNRHIISIVGMGGMGKTTLAKNIYANQLIIEHFDFRAWATVSQQYKAKEILEQLVSPHGKCSDKNENELGEQLHKTLSGRRYLIILDDIWSVQAWDAVRYFFPNNGNGSRIVLTTRLSDVADNCGSSCFAKKLLDENGGWELFCRKAFFQHEDCPTELEDVGKEIVRLCKGLPLSIVVIGGRLLKSPRTIRYWENVARDIESIPNSKEKEESLDVLLSSYNHLPAHLKPCFLYTGVLKSIKYGKFHSSRIIQLWIAEGFFISNGGRVIEDIAEEYLKDLIDRHLILVIRRSKNGRVKYCDIHDLLRDLCLKVAEQQGFFHATQGPVLGTERRLVYDNSTRVRETVRPMLARSIMDCKIHKEEYNKYKLLRILHVQYNTSVEESFGCVNLRYLAFWTPIGLKLLELSSSISLIWNLHALIIQIYPLNYLRVVAPIEIWKMQQLRHIECPQIYLPHPDEQDNLLILENFQTLENAVNLRLSEDMCKIIPNIKRLHLVYDHMLEGYDDCLIVCLCNLDRLDKLESFKLIADKEWWQLSYELSEILTFPSSLNKLSLTNCGLHWDDLIIVGSLPQLEVLKLENNSVTKGKQWSLVDGQFQRLKFLKIDECDLVCWNAERSHFPLLEKLVLRRLQEMEEIPWDIGEIATLEFIHVDRCSHSAMISALKIKDNQLEYMGNDDPQIQVDVDRDEVESFMEMVEADGLTVNNVQLNIRDY